MINYWINGISNSGKFLLFFRLNAIKSTKWADAISISIVRQTPKWWQPINAHTILSIQMAPFLWPKQRKYFFSWLNERTDRWRGKNLSNCLFGSFECDKRKCHKWMIQIRKEKNTRTISTSFHFIVTIDRWVWVEKKEKQNIKIKELKLLNFILLNKGVKAFSIMLFSLSKSCQIELLRKFIGWFV